MTGFITSGMRVALLGALAFGGVPLMTAPAGAVPARIIILRHGEKADSYRLCKVGEERAQALVAQYLGKGAQNSLFPAGQEPKAFFAITLHTLELINPTAISWGKPVITFGVSQGLTTEARADIYGQRTRQAALDLMENPAWNGATVVVTWEHVRIAKAKLQGQKKDGAPRKTAGPDDVTPVTFYDLLGLNKLAGVPVSWEGENFDYFWIVDFDPATKAPTHFQMVKQAFTGPFANLPQNDWGAPNGLTAQSGCATKP